MAVKVVRLNAPRDLYKLGVVVNQLAALTNDLKAKYNASVTLVNELKVDHNALLTKLDANHGAATDHVATLSTAATNAAVTAVVNADTIVVKW